MFKKKESQEIPDERKQALFLKIKPIIAKQLEIDEDKITLTAKINEDLGADSLDSIEIVMALEDEFNLEILDVESEKMKTVNDIVVYLAEKAQL
jgi:acyl carrier protein